GGREPRLPPTPVAPVPAEPVEVVVAVLQPREHQPEIPLKQRALERIGNQSFAALIEFGKDGQQLLMRWIFEQMLRGAPQQRLDAIPAVLVAIRTGAHEVPFVKTIPEMRPT